MASLVTECVHQSAKREVAGAERRGVLGGARYVLLCVCPRWSYQAVPITEASGWLKWELRSWGCRSHCLALATQLPSGCWRRSQRVRADKGVQSPLRAWGHKWWDANSPVHLAPSYHAFSSPAIPLTISWLCKVLGLASFTNFSSGFGSVPPVGMCCGLAFVCFLFGVQICLWNDKAQLRTSHGIIEW